MLTLPSPSPAPGAGHTAIHVATTLSPSGIFAVLVLAFAIDYWRIGPDWLSSRLAFLMALAAVRCGWDGSIVDDYTIDFATTLIEQAKATGNGRVAAANTDLVLGVAVGLLGIYCIGCLLPKRWSKRLGRWATLAFTSSGGKGDGGGKASLTGRLWVCATVLGLTSELSHGLVGKLVGGLVSGAVHLVSPLPGLFFGVDA